MTEPDAWKTDVIFGHPVCAYSKSVHPLPEVDDKDIEPLYSSETIEEEINETWQEVLQEHGDNSDKALGMKILARELKEEFKQEEGDTE